MIFFKVSQDAKNRAEKRDVWSPNIMQACPLWSLPLINTQPEQKNRNYEFWDTCGVCPTRACAALPTAGVSQRPQHPELVPGQTYWSLSSHMGRHTWVWSHGLIPLPSDTHLPAARLPQLGTAQHTHTCYHRRFKTLRFHWNLAQNKCETSQINGNLQWNDLTERQRDGNRGNSQMTALNSSRTQQLSQ